MIVAETPSAYRFITQPAHARLAGRFAERWGGESFERSAPGPAVVLAAHTHDDGWWRYDRRPHLDAAGAPVTFTSLPAAQWTELYDRGIDAVVELDPYAGLLVSMHGAGLRRRRYGLSPAWPDTPAAYADFVERQERRQRELLAALADDEPRVSAADEALLEALHETGTPPDGTGSRLWTNYALLQAWDALSLSLCTAVDPPADDEIADVPRRPGGPDATLTLSALDGGAVGVEPYPFDAAPVVVRTASRTVPKAAFDTEAELLEAYYAAGIEDLLFQLRPPD